MTPEHEFDEAERRGYGLNANMDLWEHCPQATRREILSYLLGYRSVCDYLLREFQIRDPAEHLFAWSGYARLNSIPAPLPWLAFFAFADGEFSLATLEREALRHLGPRDAVTGKVPFTPSPLMSADIFAK